MALVLPPEARRAVLLAHGGLAWERLAPLWTPAALAVVAVLGLAAVGLLQPLPVPAHAAVLALVGSAAVWPTIRAARRVRLPTRLEARRRAETDSGLRHAPLAALEDDRAAGDDALWSMHRAQADKLASRAKGRRPKAGLAAADPYALRFALPLLLIGGLGFAGDAGPRRLQTAFRPDLKADALPLTLEAWATPPAYTGRPPQPLPLNGGALVLPAGSTLAVTVHGAAGAPRFAGLSSARLERSPERSHVGRLTLQRSGDLKIQRGGTLARWRLTAEPDQRPAIAFVAPPSRGEDDRLVVVHRATDDHGVISVTLRLRRGFRTVQQPLDAPAVLGEPQASAVDLTGTPFAGQTARATLIAIDAAGNEARSPSVRVEVPRRVYTDPAAVRVAQAAALLRREWRPYALIRRPPPSPENRDEAQLMGTLGPYYALHGAPSGVRAAARTVTDLVSGLDTPVIDPVAAAGLTWATRQLAGAQSLRQAKALAGELTAVAERIERGPTGSAEDALRQAQRRLREAVARGAPPEEIARLLDEVKQAMAAYLAALSQAVPPPGASGGGTSVSDAEIEALWRAVEEALAQGDTERAMAMMDAIARLLASLQPGGEGEGQSGGQGQAGGGPLGPLRAQQQALADETFGAAQGELDRDLEAVARDQAALAGRVGQARDGTRGPAGRSLDQAASAMAEAADALRRYNVDEAVRAQRRADAALAEGARALDGARGARGLLDQALGEADPLGRRAGGSGAADGEGPAVADDPAVSAREALDAIRARAADRGRPEQELRYLDRLLERF